MAQTTKPHGNFAPLTVAESAKVNDQVNTIYNDYNGNITDFNIAAAANIQQSKILNLTGDLNNIRTTFVSQLSITQFLASGIYTKPARLVFARIVVIGGGGGGGGALSTNGSLVASGGGGGSGGYSESILLANQFAATETITLGSGGAGGTIIPTNGLNGGNSAFGLANLVFAGGGGGGGAGWDSIGLPGAGGLLGGANLPLPGMPGISGFLTVLPTGPTAIACGGTGGSISPYGCGGIAFPTGVAQAGFSGVRGGGGSGGASCNINSAVGGAGGDGTVIIYEYKYS